MAVAKERQVECGKEFCKADQEVTSEPTVNADALTSMSARVRLRRVLLRFEVCEEVMSRNVDRHYMPKHESK